MKAQNGKSQKLLEIIQLTEETKSMLLAKVRDLQRKYLKNRFLKTIHKNTAVGRKTT